MKKNYITIIALLIINFLQGQDFYFDLNKSYENKVSIYNNADKKVGYISVSSLRINYYDINNKLIKSEKSNNTITIKNFMEETKKGTIEITENRFKAGIRQWNGVSESFDVFDNNDEKIGVYFYDGNGVWKYKEEAIYKNRSSYSIKFREETNDSKNMNDLLDSAYARYNANKNKLKSVSQYISIVYANLFQKALSSNELVEITRCIESIGDKQVAHEIVLSNFMNKPDVIIPSDSLMRADLDFFLEETYKRFFVRDITEAEREFFLNYLNANPNVSSEMVYMSFALSNEYQFY